MLNMFVVICLKHGCPICRSRAVRSDIRRIVVTQPGNELKSEPSNFVPKKVGLGSSFDGWVVQKNPVLTEDASFQRCRLWYLTQHITCQGHTETEVVQCIYLAVLAERKSWTANQHFHSAKKITKNKMWNVFWCITKWLSLVCLACLLTRPLCLSASHCLAAPVCAYTCLILLLLDSCRLILCFCWFLSWPEVQPDAAELNW